MLQLLKVARIEILYHFHKTRFLDTSNLVITAHTVNILMPVM